MKKIIRKTIALSSILFLLSFSSCTSTPETTEKIAPETELNTIEEVVEAVEEIVISPEEEFLAAIENLKIEFVEAPKETTVKKDFQSAYKIAVTNNGFVSEDFEFVITYPESKTGTTINYKSETVKTDQDGYYYFVPPTPEFATISTVKAEITTDLTDEAVLAAVEQKTVCAEYKVKSNTIQKGCLLFVWEYNEKDRALNNFNDLQSALRRKNISLCGNAPINDKSDIGKSVKTLYSENYEIVEDMYGYLIIGKVKFTKPVEQTEDESGYLCSLIADISAVNMKNGSLVFEQTFTQEAIGSNWTKATTSCKTALADKIVEALIYGL